jgi:hypothetical protein
LVDVMLKQQTITSDTYIKIVKTLKKCFWWIRAHKNPAKLLLQHDNTCPHTNTFHIFGVNIYWERNVAHYFLGNSHSYKGALECNDS